MSKEILYGQLPKKEIKYSEWYATKHPHKILAHERVLFFDPTGLYARIGDKLNTSKRHAGLQMDDLFPKIEGKCACGECDLIPKSGEGWQRKWGSDECQSFASDVLSIINNYFWKPGFYISLYAGNKCCKCDNTSKLELDHIIGVKHGGGGCWLSNYRWLCKDHHNDKTNSDFGKGKYKPTIQEKLNF